MKTTILTNSDCLISVPDSTQSDLQMILVKFLNPIKIKIVTEFTKF